MTTLLTAAQVAERLDVSKRSVLRYTADGDMPAHNFQGRYYYDWEEVCQAIKRWAQPRQTHERTPAKRGQAQPSWACNAEQQRSARFLNNY